MQPSSERRLNDETGRLRQVSEEEEEEEEEEEPSAGLEPATPSLPSRPFPQFAGIPH
jgi:hypothetical protein